MTHLTTSRLLAASLGLALLGPLCIASSASAADRTWIGGNADWNALNANWSPFDEPDTDDRAIFNTPNSVDLANAAEVIEALSLSGGIDLNLNGNNLTVNGGVTTTLTGASTNLFIPTGSIFNTDDVTLSNSAAIRMTGGSFTLVQLVGEGVLSIGTGTSVSGTGTITSGDGIAAPTTVISNSGSIIANTTPFFIGGTPAAGTLSINATSDNARFDWDGGGGGILQANGNQTLDINVMPGSGALADAFSGTMNLITGSTINIQDAWALDSGTINANTAAFGLIIGGQDPNPGAAATIAGGAMTMTGGTINIDDTWDSLRFFTTLNASGGTINNSGHIIFNRTAVIGAGVDFNMTGLETIVDVNALVTVNDADWDWDAGGGSSTINIGDFGTLNANITASGDNYSTTMNINGGTLNVQANNNDWGQDAGTITVTGVSNIGGDRFLKTGGLLLVQAGADLTIATTAVPVADSGQRFSGGTVTVHGVLDLNGDFTEWAGATVNGTGRIEAGTNTVSANQTINIGVYDWDSGTTTINDNVTFTLNAGNVDQGNDIHNGTININGGRLAVNVDDGNWQLGTLGVLNLTHSGLTEPEVLPGSTLQVDSGGRIQVFGTTADIDSGVILNEGALVELESLGTDLDFNGLLTLNGGDINQIAGGATLFRSSIVVTGQSAINVALFDGDGGAIHLNAGGNLDINVTEFETTAAQNDRHDGLINFIGGILNVDVGDNIWIAEGTLRSTNGGSLFGDRIHLGDDTGVQDADIDVNGGSFNIGAPVTFFSDADVDVAAGSTLTINNANTVFVPVNGVNNGQFTGAGTLRVVGASFNEATTFDMTGGTVALDGSLSGNGGIILLTAGDNAINSTLTINAAAVEDYGFRTVIPVATSELHISNTGRLSVNLDNPNDAWTVLSNGVVNYNGAGVLRTFLTGSDINFDGTLNITGDALTTARIDFGAGNVNINSATGQLFLAGGSLADPNTMSGTTITGPGELTATINAALHGHGIVNAPIRFAGNARLIAEGGILDLNRPILDVGRIGTLDTGVTPTLDIGLAWNTNVADEVLLQGGRLVGANITNDLATGIQGFGLISAFVNNNTQITAVGGTLVVNDADWDGSTESGRLNAQAGNLELTDPAGFFGFDGTVNIRGGREVFVNGFNLGMNAGSTLAFVGGTYRSNFTQGLRGTIVTNVAAATLQTNSSIQSSANVTLNGDLLLDGNTLVEAGAAFAGPAALVNLAGRELTLADGADVDVVLENRGTLMLGTSPGQTTGTDFEQTGTGIWEVELAGTGLNDFDRMNLTGLASLAGTLDLDIGGGYAPAVGDTFNILSAGGGVVGTFDTIQQANAGVVFRVNYLPTLVQLEGALGGDLNGDGFVGADDLDILLANWGDSVATGSFIDGDASGDGLVNNDDFAIVQANWGNGTPPAAIPEPGTAVMLGLMLLTGARRRRV